MSVFDFFLILALVPPPIAIIWMIYRHIRYSKPDYFGIAIGLVISAPLVLHLVGEAAWIGMWAGEGEGAWSLTAAYAVQLTLGVVGGVLQKLILQKK